MNKLKPLCLVAACVIYLIIGLSNANAQGFSSILDKLDKLELKINNLEQRINEDSRKSQDISGLESRVNGLEKQVSSVAASKPDISGLENRLASLEADLSNPETNQDWDFIENSIVELAFQVKQLEDNYTAGNISGGAGMDGQYLAQLQEITEDLKTTVAEFTGHPEGKPKKSSVKIDRTPKIAGMLKSFWIYDIKESSDNQNYFKVNNMFVGIKGDLSDDISYNFLIDFTRSGADIILNGFVAFRPSLWSEVTIGQFLTPYSSMSLRATSKQWFISRPLISSKIFPPLRDIGIAFSAISGNYSTTVGVFNGSGMNQIDGNSAKNLVGRMVYKLSPQLNLSGNIVYGKTNAADSLAEDLKMYDGGVSYSHQNFLIEGEYGYCETETLIKTGFFMDALYTVPTTGIIKSITPGVRYDWYDPCDDVSGDVQKRYTAGVKMIFVKFPRMHIRADYQYNDIENSETHDNKFLAEVQITF